MGSIWHCRDTARAMSKSQSPSAALNSAVPSAKKARYLMALCTLATDKLPPPPFAVAASRAPWAEAGAGAAHTSRISVKASTSSGGRWRAYVHKVGFNAAPAAANGAPAALAAGDGPRRRGSSAARSASHTALTLRSAS